MKRTSSFLLLLAWMTLIFIFSAMNENSSHAKSREIAKSIVEQKENILTSESNEIISNSDINQEVNNYKLHKKSNQEIDWLVLKYDEPIRKTAHILEYFILILLVINFIFQVVELIKRRDYLVGIVFCVLYAGLDELHQRHVAGRSRAG